MIMTVNIYVLRNNKVLFYVAQFIGSFRAGQTFGGSGAESSTTCRRLIQASYFFFIFNQKLKCFYLFFLKLKRI